MSRRMRWTARLLVAAMGAALLAAIPTPAGAITVLNVTTTADDGSGGSLRGMLGAATAAGDDVLIQLESGQTYVINRLCQNGDLDDNHGGDLDWGGAHDLIISAIGSEPATIEVQCNGERVLDHRGSERVTLRRLRITGGNLPDGANGISTGGQNGSSAESGGGIRAIGPLQLDSTIVEGNRTGDGGDGVAPNIPIAGGTGGAGGDGGGIAGDVVVLSNSTVRDNVAGDGGDGGVGQISSTGGAAGRGGDGGGIWALDLTMTASSVTGNTAGTGGRGGNGGPTNGNGGSGGNGGRMGGAYGATASIVRSAFIDNEAGDGGSGGDGFGTGSGGDGGDAGNFGGVRGFNVNITNSTVHGNRGGTPGAGGAGGSPSPGLLSSGGGLGISSAGDILFTTVTGNASGAASNIAAHPLVTITASVVGEPGSTGANCSNFLISEGWNVSDSGSCLVGTGTDLVTIDVHLADLADNGGPSLTRLPDLRSPLHDRIPRATCDGLLSSPRVDQRLELREVANCEPGAAELPPIGAAKFTALPPKRVFDTRTAQAPSGIVGPGQTLTVDFTGAHGVPSSGVTAVAFNLTIDAAGGEGFVTAWPGGLAQPLASNLNTIRTGQTVPNMVIVPVGANGTVSFYTQLGGHLLADIAGYFSEVGATEAGRIITVTPERLFDTRTPAAPSGQLIAAGEISIPVLGEAGVPASGVSAVVLNLTGTEAAAEGYVTAWPDLTARPNASNLNLAGPGHTAANLVIVPLGANGAIRLFSQSGAHLLADVTAWITDDGVVQSTGMSEGLMVPLAPARVFDTRTGASPSGFVGNAQSIAAPHRGVAGVPSYAAGAILNTTATQAAAEGFVTAWPEGIAQPLASTLNLTEVGETRANAAILPIGAGGGIAYYSQSGTHLLADVFGYLLPESVAD